MAPSWPRGRARSGVAGACRSSRARSGRRAFRPACRRVSEQLAHAVGHAVPTARAASIGVIEPRQCDRSSAQWPGGGPRSPGAASHCRVVVHRLPSRVDRCVSVRVRCCCCRVKLSVVTRSERCVHRGVRPTPSRRPPASGLAALALHEIEDRHRRCQRGDHPDQALALGRLGIDARVAIAGPHRGQAPRQAVAADLATDRRGELGLHQRRPRPEARCARWRNVSSPSSRRRRRHSARAAGRRPPSPPRAGPPSWGSSGTPWPPTRRLAERRPAPTAWPGALR